LKYPDEIVRVAIYVALDIEEQNVLGGVSWRQLEGDDDVGTLLANR
jgi:hypothetical protein